MGVAISLPWLESLRVWGAETPAVGDDFPRRFAALFMGNGISPEHWRAKGSGAEMELSKCLEPLAPLRSKLNVIDGLFNKQATGVGIHPGQTLNLDYSLTHAIRMKGSSRLQVGLVGYHQWQTTDKSGPTITSTQAVAHYRVSALGFTSSVVIPAPQVNIDFN